MENEEQFLTTTIQEHSFEHTIIDLINEGMVWSYEDWTSVDGNFVLTERMLTLIKPNHLEVKMLITSNKIISTTHPSVIVKIYDEQNTLLVEWNSGEFVLDCNSYYYYSRKADLVPLYVTAFKAVWYISGYNWKKC